MNNFFKHFPESDPEETSRIFFGIGNRPDFNDVRHDNRNSGLIPVMSLKEKEMRFSEHSISGTWEIIIFQTLFLKIFPYLLKQQQQSWKTLSCSTRYQNWSVPA
ncbi:MAG: hypothetical protein GY749_47865 [Desulfobacteraceae bacterium]|nr:hypothetical protein [Desulfobacteraceae bacterium]